MVAARSSSTLASEAHHCPIIEHEALIPASLQRNTLELLWSKVRSSMDVDASPVPGTHAQKRFPLQTSRRT
eukprot:4109774-Pleurochrysis_carterae.AAC.3